MKMTTKISWIHIICLLVVSMFLRIESAAQVNLTQQDTKFSYARYKRILSTPQLTTSEKDSIQIELATQAFQSGRKRISLKYFHKNRRKIASNPALQKLYYQSAKASNRILLANLAYDNLSPTDRILLKPYEFKFFKTVDLQVGYLNNDDYSRTQELIAIQKEPRIVSPDVVSENNNLNWVRFYRLGGLIHIDKRIWLNHAITFKETYFTTHIVSEADNVVFKSLNSSFQYYIEFVFKVDRNWQIRPSIHTAGIDQTNNKYDYESNLNEMQPHAEMYYGMSVDYKDFLWEVTSSVSIFESDSISRFQMGADLKWYLWGSNRFWINPGFYLNDWSSVYELKAGVKVGMISVTTAYLNGNLDYLSEANQAIVNNNLFSLKSRLRVFAELPVLKDRGFLSLRISQYNAENRWSHLANDGIRIQRFSSLVDQNSYFDVIGSFKWIF